MNVILPAPTSKYVYFKHFDPNIERYTWRICNPKLPGPVYVIRPSTILDLIMDIQLLVIKS